MTLLSSIKMEDVEILEGIFAYLTEDGWVIPAWLVTLREHVTARDAQNS